MSIVTVAGVLSSDPSLALYWNVTTPTHCGDGGVYVNEPFADEVNVPCDGGLTITRLSGSPSGS